MSNDVQWAAILSSLASFQVAFLGLKLAGQLNWSWLWVLFPLWGPGGVLAAAVLFIMASVVLFH